MTTKEFSSEFDILYNNIMSNQSPGLDEYEKSVLLTQAQESLILDIYTGKYKSSFESTEEVISYINTLIKQETITNKSSGSSIVNDSVFYELPEDLWYITYEVVDINDPSLECGPTAKLIVKPVTQDEFYSINRNPFRGANNKRVLRLISDNKAEIISKYNVESYTVRYISKPSPIILTNLSDYNGISINGVTSVTECALNPLFHRIILNRAVELAKALWTTNN